MVSWAVFNSIFQENIVAITYACHLQCTAFTVNVRRYILLKISSTQNRAHLCNRGPVWKCFCIEQHLLTLEKANLSSKEFSSQGKQVSNNAHCPVKIIRTFYVSLANVFMLIPENAHRRLQKCTCVGKGVHPEMKIPKAALKCSPLHLFSFGHLLEQKGLHPERQTALLPALLTQDQLHLSDSVLPQFCHHFRNCTDTL